MAHRMASSDSFTTKPEWAGDLPPWLAEDYTKLCHLHRDQHLPHALLLAGSSGIGKHQLALAFASSMLCTHAEKVCGDCHSCKLWAAGNHPDFWHLQPEEGKQVISIDQVRSLLEFAYKTPQIAAQKAIVVWPADLMNRNAANALLKCLEEPPPSTQFVLSSANPGRLPATIRSRCQVVRVSEPDDQQAQQWLRGCGLDEELAQQYLQLSSGQPLLALEQGEQLLKMNQALAAAMQMAVSSRASIVQLTKPLLSFEIKSLFDAYLRLLSAIVRGKLGGASLAPEERPAWLKTAEQDWDVRKLLEHAQFVQNTLKSIHAGSHFNDQLILEDLFIRLALCTQQD